MKFLNWLFSWRDSKEQPRTEIVRGDLLELATGNNFDVIIHGCNCFHSMSGGIARAIAKKWPSAETADAMTPKGDKFKLGTYSTAVVEGKEDYAPYEVMIINAYTQYNPGADVNYEAIRDGEYSKIPNHGDKKKVKLSKLEEKFAAQGLTSLSGYATL